MSIRHKQEITMTAVSTAKENLESVGKIKTEETEIIDLHGNSNNYPEFYDLDLDKLEELAPEVEKDLNLSLIRDILNFTANCLTVSLVSILWLLSAVPVMGLINSKEWGLNTVISETTQILDNINSNVSILTFISLLTIATIMTKKLSSIKSS